jgi:hypothetical protein
MKLTDHDHKTLALIDSMRQGVTAHDVAACLEMPRIDASEVLRKLRKLGLVAPTSSAGPQARWTRPDRLAGVVKLMKAESAAREKNRVRPNRRHRAKLGGDFSADDDHPYLYPIHRWVKAHEAPRLRKLGPASVFHWAQV